MEPEIEITEWSGRITPIRYCYRDSDAQILYPEFIELILENDEIESWEPSLVRLAQIDDHDKCRPTVIEFHCQMESGIRAVFRMQDEGIHQALSWIKPSEHSKRQRAAYLVSKFLETDTCPISVITHHPLLGIGSLTAMVEGRSFLLLNPETKSTIIPGYLKKEISLCEAYVFDYLINSGQRGMSSYLIDENGRIISQYHHEAFEFLFEPVVTMSLFRASGRTVSQAFWKPLQEFCDRHDKISSLGAELVPLIGRENTDVFFARLLETVQTRCVGEYSILVKE